MTDRKTVAGAFAAIEKHEDECAIRYSHLAEIMSAFREKLDSSHRRAGRIELAAWGLLVSLVLTLGGLVLKLSVGA